MAEENDNKEFDAELPGGIKLRTKGYRMADLFNVLLLVALCGIGYLVWEHKSDARAGGLEIANAMKAAQADSSAALKDVAASQRLFACIIAQPQESRMTEFANENSFCGRMSKLR